MLVLNNANFEEEVLDYDVKPVLVEFWGPNCGVCSEITPGIHKLEGKYSSKIKFASLNVAEEKRLAIIQRVLSLPTLIMYRQGEKLDKLTSDKIKNIDDVDKFINNLYEKL